MHRAGSCYLNGESSRSLIYANTLRPIKLFKDYQLLGVDKAYEDLGPLFNPFKLNSFTLVTLFTFRNTLTRGLH